MATLLSEVLDRCIDLVMVHGWSIDDCASEWPEHAADLRGLLSTACELASLSVALSADLQVPVVPYSKCDVPGGVSERTAGSRRSDGFFRVVHATAPHV